MTLSPWLIHTWWRSADRPKAVEQGAFLGHVQEGAPEFAAPLTGRAAFFDGAAKLVAHHLLAIADPEDRQTCCRTTACGARGLFSSGTPAGDPDRMMPLGVEPLERGGGRL